MAADVTIFYALIAGLVSFLSPCVLPLVPPYLVYLAGTSLERLADKAPVPRVKRDTVLAATLFVAGFSTVFVALGASASALGALLRFYSNELAIVGYGGAQKLAVAKMVQRLLNLAELPAPDAADALALALAFTQEASRPALSTLKRV